MKKNSKNIESRFLKKSTKRWGIGISLGILTIIPTIVSLVAINQRNKQKTNSFSEWLQNPLKYNTSKNENNNISSNIQVFSNLDLFSNLIKRYNQSVFSNNAIDNIKSVNYFNILEYIKELRKQNNINGWKLPSFERNFDSEEMEILFKNYEEIINFSEEEIEKLEFSSVNKDLISTLEFIKKIKSLENLKKLYEKIQKTIKEENDLFLEEVKLFYDELNKPKDSEVVQMSETKETIKEENIHPLTQVLILMNENQLVKERFEKEIKNHYFNFLDKILYDESVLININEYNEIWAFLNNFYNKGASLIQTNLGEQAENNGNFDIQKEIMLKNLDILTIWSGLLIDFDKEGEKKILKEENEKRENLIGTLLTETREKIQNYNEKVKKINFEFNKQLITTVRLLKLLLSNIGLEEKADENKTDFELKVFDNNNGIIEKFNGFELNEGVISNYNNDSTNTNLKESLQLLVNFKGSFLSAITNSDREEKIRNTFQHLQKLFGLYVLLREDNANSKTYSNILLDGKNQKKFLEFLDNLVLNIFKSDLIDSNQKLNTQVYDFFNSPNRRFFISPLEDNFYSVIDSYILKYKKSNQ